VVVITGSGASQRGVPEGYRLRGHHWPERWVTDVPGERRAPELFIAGELLDDAGRAVLEVMLHEAAHALAAARGIKDCSAAGNRYHNRRYAALAAEVGLAPPERPHKILGMSGCTIAEQAAAAYAEVIEAIGAARLPYITEPPRTGSTGGPGGGTGRGGGGDTPVRPEKRDGRRIPVTCACTPPRRIQVTPKTINDGPVICGLCHAIVQQPGQAGGRKLPVLAGADGTPRRNDLGRGRPSAPGPYCNPRRHRGERSQLALSTRP
jgi:hypothetical protein